MRKRIGSLLLAVSLSLGMVASPYYHAGVSVVYADEVNVLRKAELKGDGSIDINVKNPYESETDITSITKIVDETGAEIKVTKATVNGRRGNVTIDGELEFGHTYTMTIEGFEEGLAVSTAGLFSTEKFESTYHYDGNDLGATWTKDKTTFKVWAPTATSVKLNIYTSGTRNADDLEETIEMTQGEKGVWSVEKAGDLNGKYYTYFVAADGSEREACDPYAKAVGINGDRAMVIDLDSTDPEGWDKDVRHTPANITDAIIYELHVRDFSVKEGLTFPAEHVGKFLAFTDKGVTTATGEKAGIDHIVDLGANMVHILPSYDFGSVKEETGGYNWGYDPKNYQVPEGSYSTDATKGEVRVKEFKQMVQALHNENIGVIQDVVYNHTQSLAFSYNYVVPGYYHRANSNGSGCGNDVASERSMVSKYIVDSVVYWAEEYHLDGFRFDLMGLHDVDTMNAVRKALDEIDPTIIVYGEGWTMSTNTTKDVLLATQKNCSATEGIAYFSDGIRDAVVNASFGSEGKKPGYANGAKTPVADMKDYITGRYTSNAKDKAVSPDQVINYITCHDGYTLWDKINISNAADSEADKIKQHLLSYAIILTSQGTPFVLSGDEFLRTKVKENGTFDHNSYMSGDKVNELDYARVGTYQQVYDYMKGLIAFRKAHSGFRCMTFEEIDASYTWLEGLDEQVIAYTIKGGTNGEVSDNVMVIYNPNKTETTITLPEGEWQVCINGEKAGTQAIEKVSGTVKVAPISCYALVQGKLEPEKQSTTTPGATTATAAPTTNNDGGNKPPIVPIVIGIVVVIGVVVVVVKKRQ